MLSTYHQPDYHVSATARLKLKICGIMQPEHARVAARCGADMVGVVFAASRRRVTIDEAIAIRQALGNSPVRPRVVGVFVNETPEHILAVARTAHLDIVQLSGDESPETVAECAAHLQVIKALRFPVGTPHDEALAILDAYTACNLGNRLRFLVDAYHPREYGGTGQIADWSLAARLAEKHPIILAGGLNASNVLSATHQVSPWGVDVSSGVERNGVKDPQLIREFVEAVSMSS